MAPIHPKMVEYEPWSGWYKQVIVHWREDLNKR
jgi:hypothetical protein